MCIVVEMSIASHGAEDEYELPTDFTAGPFVTRRESPPLKDLINTFSELYLNSDNDNDSDAPPDIPLPPDDMIPVLPRNWVMTWLSESQL